MYAIVATGGKQYKVAVGDVVEVEKITAAPGDSVTLPAVLLVDEGAVTHDAAALAKASVTAEVIGAAKGPKIKIHKYKNKTGYHKRMGHRQQLTHLRITAVDNGTAVAAKKVDTAKVETASVSTTKADDTDGES